jgi:hypothetical protein
MVQLKVDRVEEGLTSTERAVYFKDDHGRQHEVHYAERQVHEVSIDVILVHAGSVATLVELTRETVNGRWRVWVPSENVIREDGVSS